MKKTKWAADLEEGEAEAGFDTMLRESTSGETWMMRRSLAHRKLQNMFQAEKTAGQMSCWGHQPSMLLKQETGQQIGAKEGSMVKKK